MTRLPEQCRALLEHQHGVIARWQAAQVGLELQVIDAQLRRGRWQPLYHGVYAAFTGQPPRAALLWAAVLRAGPGAVLSHHSAAELDGLADRPAEAIHVLVERTRRLTLSDGGRAGEAPRIVVRYSNRASRVRHPSRTPPRTRIEETALDLTQSAQSLDEAISWLTSACSRRLTTPELLSAAMTARSRLRWRSDLAGVLADASTGILSVLERRYVYGVERAHGLPRADRQSRSRVGRRTRYLDNLYQEFGVAVEVDGRAAHPAESRWRDIYRDNASAAAGLVTLRYGWADVTGRACRVAAETAMVLRQRGWHRRPRPCGPGCLAGLIGKDSQSL